MNLSIKVLIFSISILCFACNTTSPAKSDAKYGVIEDQIRTSILWQKPGHEIMVCGNNAEQVAEAVKEWFDVINRTKHLKISHQESCENIGNPNALIRVRNLSQPSGPDLKTTDCTPNTLGYTMPIKGGYGAINHGADIVFCETPTKKVILHEIGHVAGMCDQYSSAFGILIEKIGMHISCNEKFSGAKATTSVMNAGDSGMENLQSDDRLGIRMLACRKSTFNEWPFGIEISEEWVKTIGSDIQTWDLDAMGKEMDRINIINNGQQFIDGCVNAVKQFRAK